MSSLCGPLVQRKQDGLCFNILDRNETTTSLTMFLRVSEFISDKRWFELLIRTSLLTESRSLIMQTFQLAGEFPKSKEKQETRAN